MCTHTNTHTQSLTPHCSVDTPDKAVLQDSAHLCLRQIFWEGKISLQNFFIAGIIIICIIIAVGVPNQDEGFAALNILQTSSKR